MEKTILQNQLWRSSPMHYKGVGVLILFLLLSPMLYAQSLTVKGKTTEENGQPMPGVTVSVKGTTNATSTDADGNYSLVIPDGATEPTLVFSFIGYATQEQALSGRSTINVQLASDIKELSEVVVVGYGTQRKRDVTGSIASVNSDALKEVPVANLQQGLQGRAAGLEVQQIGTTPGSGAQIRIRGERSVLGSNNPLIVVDGIPFDNGDNNGTQNSALNDINPSDIASIEVLKDGSATAIYGSRGANGVILVTTKRGKGGPTRVSVNSYYGVSSVTRKYPVYNAQEYRAMRDNSNWTSGYQAGELAGIADGTNTNWQDLMYQHGYITDHNVSITGGTENQQVAVSGGYFKQTTIMPGQDFTRYNLKIADDFKVGKHLKLGFNTMNNMQVTNGSQFVNGAATFPMLSLSPLMKPYDANGNLITSPVGDVDDLGGTYNPLMLKHNNNQWVDQIKRLRTFNTMYAEVKIIDGLTYRFNLGLDYNHQENDQFKGANSFFRTGKGNTASVNNSETWGFTEENLLTYNKTFNNVHNLQVQGLYSSQAQHSHNTSISKDSIDADFIQFYNLGQSKQSTTNLPTYNGSESSWALVSYMARINYTYNDKYMITLTGRIDGSSRLAAGHNYHKYPAVSAGWNISNENFMQDVTAITNLKLRAGYAETSNQAVNPYSSLGNVVNTYYNSSAGSLPIKYNFGPQIASGYYASTLVNANLDWEYTRSTNIGLDFGVLKNRLTGSIDVYEATTHKILFAEKLPASSGVTSSYLNNIGTMSNKGIELSLSSTNIQTSSGFTWSTDLNLFFNRNKLLTGNNGFTYDIANQLFPGQPMTAIYDYTKLGIWQTSEAAQAAVYGQAPGQLKIKDIGGLNSDGTRNNTPDGKITASADRSVIGNQQATIQGGMTNRFTYKGFDFSFVLYARFGGLVISAIHQPQYGYLTIGDGKRNGLKVDYWTPTNPSNAFPSLTAASNGAPTGNGNDASSAWTTLGYYDASFIKVRSINFGYTIPKSIVSRIKAQSVRVYFQTLNPFLLYSPYVKAGGVDPEATGTGTTGFVGSPGNISTRALTISASTPPTKSLIFGLNVTF